LKVHDFNYLEKLVEHCAKLFGTSNKVSTPFDGSDTLVSELSWEIALRATGCVIEACDKVMDG